jgi:hypothetical protein
MKNPAQNIQLCNLKNKYDFAVGCNFDRNNFVQNFILSNATECNTKIDDKPNKHIFWTQLFLSKLQPNAKSDYKIGCVNKP